MIEIKYSFGSQAFVIHLIAAFDLNFEFFALNKKVTLSIRKKKQQKIPVLPTDISTKMIIDSTLFIKLLKFNLATLFEYNTSCIYLKNSTPGLRKLRVN